MSSAGLSATATAATTTSPILNFYISGGADPLDRTHDEMLAYSLDRMEECHDYVQWMWPLHEPSAFAVVFPVLTKEDVDALSSSEEARGRMRSALQRFRLFYGLPEATASSGGAVIGGASGGGGEATASSGGAVIGGASSGGGEATVSSSGAVIGGASSGGGDGTPENGDSKSGASVGGGGSPTGVGEGKSSSSSGGSGSSGSGTGAAVIEASGASTAGAAGDSEEDNDGLPCGFSSERASLWSHNGDHNLLRVTRIIRSLRFFGLEAESRAFYRDAVAVAQWAGLSRTTLSYWKKASGDDVWKSMR